MWKLLRQLLCFVHAFIVHHPTDKRPGLWITTRRSRYREAKGASVGTISRPSGSRESGTILKLAMPNGMPMIVTHRARPVTMWLMASHQLYQDEPQHVADA